MLLASSSVAPKSNSLEAYVESLRRPPREFAEWVERIAGKGALACSHNSSREQKSASLACAQEAISSARPFWISYHVLEADYVAWVGVARNASGNIWVVTYDNGETMRGRERPRSITIVTCHRLAMDNRTIQCADASWSDESLAARNDDE
jgi:hypothetical protein